jgi:hypothetical protein
MHGMENVEFEPSHDSEIAVENFGEKFVNLEIFVALIRRKVFIPCI